MKSFTASANRRGASPASASACVAAGDIPHQSPDLMPEHISGFHSFATSFYKLQEEKLKQGSKQTTTAMLCNDDREPFFCDTLVSTRRFQVLS